MTRCVYLTFFGEYRGHGHPHESSRAITVPLVILAGFSVVAGFANAVPLGIEKFTEWFEPTFAFPHLVHAEFDYGLAIASVSIAIVGIGVAAYLWFRKEELGPFRGLTQRSAAARSGYAFLENKYYLDRLYENVIVDGIRGGIARACYWFDQHVIDAVVNGLGRGAARTGRFAYDVIDQRGVDGSINAIAAGTGDAGGAVQTLQSGRVQRYALMLFASVGVMALAVFLANTI
jgi:NADH-quinone oxidoreductase subunit L